MTKLYSVSVNWGEHEPTVQDAEIIEGGFSAPDDWLRFSGSQWFVWTGLTRAQIVASIKPITQVYTDVYFVVVSIEPIATDGAAPEWVWNWLNQKQSQQMENKFKSGD